jgi:type IV pilus biogenesis protein CpaD/CtpE
MGRWRSPGTKGVVLVVALGLLAAGCAMRQRKVIHDLEHPAPVNCNTAEGDLRVLQSEKANVAERIAEGVTAVAPAGAALGILTWTEPTKIKVAAGEYNKMIDKRMAQIRQEYGL